MRAMLALLVAVFVTPAFADDVLSPVVVTATRVPTPEADIPAGVSVVDDSTIEIRDYNTLVDALSAIPGVRVAQSGGPGGNASIFVRGTNSDHVLVLLDGMPINDAADSSGAFNFGTDTLADIERIEVIRGPMAALYGSGAIGGVINLITRRGEEPGLHVETDLAGGYPAQVRGSAVLSGIEGPLDYALTVASQSQRGYDTTPQRESIYTGTPQGYRDRLVTLNLGYTVVPGTRLSLLLRGREAIFGFNELGDPTFDMSNATGWDSSMLGRVGVSSKLFGGAYQTSLFLGRLQEDRRYFEPLNLADPNLAMVDDRYHSYRTDLQWNNTVHLDDLLHVAALSATDATFGYEYTADNIKLRTNSAFAGFPFAQSATAAQTDDAAYAGLQSTLWHRLTMIGQVRQDWIGPNTPTTWRLGAVVQVPEIDTRFKAAYGTAFRAPSLFDRYGVDSSGYVGNPNLLPESAQGWEAGFTTTLPVLHRANALSFGATYFNEQVNNLIVAVDTATEDTAENIGSAHMQGVETELTLRAARWLLLQATWTYTYARDADNNSQLLRRPAQAASLDATITPIPRLTIVPELLYTGAFQDFFVNNSGFSTSNIVTSQHGLIAKLTVTYDVAPKVQVYANGTNIFDSKFEPVNGYQTPGPTVIAGVRLSL
jgi:vitamin B12 transporter